MATITDPSSLSIKNDPFDTTATSIIRDRDLRAVFVKMAKEGSNKNRRFIYNKCGMPLGIVTFEHTYFSPYTGRKRRL